jgi:hypothetical protein
VKQYLNAKVLTSYGRVARFLLTQNTQIMEKYTIFPLNDRKIYQMTLIYIFQMAIENTNLFHPKATKKLEKLGVLV